ncbi:MAG: helix-turn-helix transcriptional regulator [Deltaproteobacteria bacterium]|jgi:transcriptional regulator with XRE-family HTH domain
MSSKKYQDSEDTFGSRLRSFRKSMGKNVTEFSKLIGISQASLSDIENNKTKTSSETLSKLIWNTDIDIKWLLTGLPGKLEEEATVFGGGRSPLDSDLLRGIIEVLEDMLAEKHLELTPAKKAELISLLYDHLSETTRKADKETVARFLSLAA